MINDNDYNEAIARWNKILKALFKKWEEETWNFAMSALITIMSIVEKASLIDTRIFNTVDASIKNETYLS